MSLGAETLEQITVIDYIRAQFPQIFPHVIHIPNGGKSSKFTNYLKNRMGQRSGAADLFIAYPNKGKCGLFVEMKSKNGRPTKLQKDFAELMTKSGYEAHICYGASSAIDVIRVYLTNGV